VSDPRLTPARPDLAAAHLKGRVEALRFVEGFRRGVTAPSAPLRRRPSVEAPLDTEALFGEQAAVYEERDGWAWVQLERDGYVGYLPSAALGAPGEATHRVASLRTHAYPGPSIKSPPLRGLSFGAQISVVRAEGDFLVGNDGAHYWARHLALVASAGPDFVDVALRFLHVPYLWGGRTSEGLDCSGLVQTALTACGIAAPRDSDMLERFGEPLPADAPRRRGDLVFWRGHVGLMSAPDRLLHANGFHMAVVEEDFGEACQRIEAKGGGKVSSASRVPQASR
jgi:cell wall-associated NlpC family hydrolase